MQHENVAKETNEVYLLEKIKKFQTDSDETLTPEERQQVIHWLLEGKKIDLSGVTAIRGFLYQYYVAVFYMVEMLCSETWWTEVVFELLDDIALVGDGKIRFVQVKTVLEGGQDNHLTPSDLCNRKDGLSWLDKVFLLNTQYLEAEGNVLSNNRKIIENFDVQFEIATNAQYGKRILGDYGKNSSFNFSPNESDDLAKRLKEKFSKTVEHRGLELTLDQTSFEDEDHGVVWYLQRFYLNHLGSFAELEKQIVYKLMGVFEKDYGNLKPYIADMVVQKLLSRIINLTHRDDLRDTTKFIFKEELLRAWVAEFAHESHTSIYEQAKENLLKFSFEKLFRDAADLIREYEGSNLLKDELIRTLKVIEDEFLTQLEKGDIYVYERFLNRLFDLRYSHAPFSLDNSRYPNLVMESLINMALSLSCYSEKQLVFNEGKLFFKQAQEGITIKDTFAIYSARKQERYEVAARRVFDAVQECSHSQMMGDNYYCFITHAKSVNSTTYKDHQSVAVPITSSGTEDASVVERHLNIKFRPGSLLEEFSEEWQEDDESSSFTEPRMIEKWQNRLKSDEME